MSNIIVKWQQMPIADVEVLNSVSHSHDLYFLTRGKTLLYIGLTYEMHVADEIRQTLRAFDSSTQGLTVFIGEIDLSKSTITRRTRELTRDVERLLIFRNQPIWNTQDKQHIGRTPLTVKNVGSQTFLQEISTE